MTIGRRGLLASLGAGAAGLLLLPRRFDAACRSVGSGPVGDAFAGGLETRSGVNVGYWPFRVETSAARGGTWLYSGDMTGAGRRIAFLANGVEVGVTSDLNLGSCNDRNGVTGNCASNSPRLRPPVGQWRWCYPERFPAAADGVAACTSDQGWIDHNDLRFAGYRPHTIKKGPAGRDFEVFTASCEDGRAIAANGKDSPRWGGNPECNAVNACDEGDGDCASDDGDAVFFGEDSALMATCLGGYEYSPRVAGGCSPDMADGSEMPLSYLFTAPRSNTKTYLHAADQVRVLYRKTLDIGHGDGTTTTSTWYGVEVAASQCPLLCPAGTRGWVMAYSQWDHDKTGRGLFFSEI